MTEDPTTEATDFRLFIQKIGMQAFYALGLLEIPGAPEMEEPNLEAAKAVIDDLMLLREKTRGNLTEGERMTLEKFLSDLQFQFVERAKGASGGAGGEAGGEAADQG